MRKVFKSVFFLGAIGFLSLLLTSGTSSAQTVSVGPTANYNGGNPPTIDIEATIDCQGNGGYVLAFEATQNQGRYEGFATFQDTCSNQEGNVTITLSVFDGFKQFRSGPFTLVVRIFDDTTGAFVKGLGFYLKGK